MPDQILSKVTETQKVQTKLDAEMRELRAKRDTKVEDLRSWSVALANADLSWRMVADRVEMGFFNHDVVARADRTGIEVCCRFPASDENKGLKNTLAPGSLFVCTGRLQPITSSSSMTSIVLENATFSDLSGSGKGGTPASRTNANPVPEPPVKAPSEAKDSLEGTLLRRDPPTEEGIFRMGTFAGQLMWAQEHCSGATSAPIAALLEAHRSHNMVIFDRGGQEGHKQCQAVAKAYTTESSCKAIVQYYGPTGSMLPGAWLSR